MLNAENAQWQRKMLHSVDRAAEALAKFRDEEGVRMCAQIRTTLEQIDGDVQLRCEKRRLVEKALEVAIKIAAIRGLRARA